MGKGWIYKITNKKNGKVYIGQTSHTLESRWKKHCSVARSGRDGKSPTGIGGAIRKYGENNFIIEPIEKCFLKKLNEREIHWIKHYNSFEKGYNLTLGGDGYRVYAFDLEEVKENYEKFETIQNLAKHYGCSKETMSAFLHNNNVPIKRPGRIENLKGGRLFTSEDRAKPIKIIELDKDFPSGVACADWLIENGYTKTKKRESVSKRISSALTGQEGRKSYLGFHFKFIQP